MLNGLLLHLLPFLTLWLVLVVTVKLQSTEAQCCKVVFQFFIGNSAVKVIIHCLHEFKHLLLANSEAHPLQHVVELINFDVVVFVVIDFLEYLLQGHTSLLQNFD